MADTSDAHYRAGYDDARDNLRHELATILRLNAVSTGEDNEQPLTDDQVREIFAGVFGVKECDDEFGPKPSGAGVRAKLEARGDI